MTGGHRGPRSGGDLRGPPIRWPDVPGAKGLGIVEVIVAFALLGVVVVALLGLQASSLRATRTAQMTRIAAAALEAELDLRAVLGHPAEGAEASTDPGECLIGFAFAGVEQCEVQSTCAVECSLPAVAVSVTTTSGLTLSALGPISMESTLGPLLGADRPGPVEP